MVDNVQRHNICILVRGLRTSWCFLTLHSSVSSLVDFLAEKIAFWKCLYHIFWKHLLCLSSYRDHNIQDCDGLRWTRQVGWQKMRASTLASRQVLVVARLYTLLIPLSMGSCTLVVLRKCHESRRFETSTQGWKVALSKTKRTLCLDCFIVAAIALSHSSMQ
jgi:hypothetical protein